MNNNNEKAVRDEIKKTVTGFAVVLLCAGGLAIGEVFRQGTVRDKQVRTIATKVDMGVLGKISAISQNQIGNIYKDFITASQEPVKNHLPKT